LKYEAGTYGPYAHNLNFLLENLEGHYIRGYGDNQNPDTDIELLPTAKFQAEVFLKDHADSRIRLKNVSELIEGFETPYGMELLSSVHWVAVHSNPSATDKKDAIELVHHWNKRKKKMFKQEHIVIAWERLVEEGWLARRIR